MKCASECSVRLDKIPRFHAFHVTKDKVPSLQTFSKDHGSRCFAVSGERSGIEHRCAIEAR